MLRHTPNGFPPISNRGVASDSPTPAPPTSPSKGHLCYLVSDTGTVREADQTDAGELYIANASNCIDIQTGYRMGRWEAPKHMAAQMLASLVESYTRFDGQAIYPTPLCNAPGCALPADPRDSAETCAYHATHFGIDAPAAPRAAAGGPPMAGGSLDHEHACPHCGDCVRWIGTSCPIRTANGYHICTACGGPYPLDCVPATTYATCDGSPTAPPPPMAGGSGETEYSEDGRRIVACAACGKHKPIGLGVEDKDSEYFCDCVCLSNWERRLPPAIGGGSGEATRTYAYESTGQGLGPCAGCGAYIPKGLLVICSGIHDWCPVCAYSGQYFPRASTEAAILKFWQDDARDTPGAPAPRTEPPMP